MLPARTVLYDACVLYPAPLRDLLMRVALADLVRARWTDAIHDEWIRNVLINRPDLTREHLERTRELMNAHVRDCLVRDYEELIGSLTLPDPNDRHVLAAAIHCHADAILTFNLRDFPAAVLAPYGIDVQHPDDFIADLLDSEPHAVCAAIQRQRQALRKPPLSPNDFLTTLERQGLTQTVQRLRTLIDQI